MTTWIRGKVSRVTSVADGSDQVELDVRDLRTEPNTIWGPYAPSWSRWVDQAYFTTDSVKVPNLRASNPSRYAFTACLDSGNYITMVRIYDPSPPPARTLPHAPTGTITSGSSQVSYGSQAEKRAMGIIEDPYSILSHDGTIQFLITWTAATQPANAPWEAVTTRITCKVKSSMLTKDSLTIQVVQQSQNPMRYTCLALYNPMNNTLRQVKICRDPRRTPSPENTRYKVSGTVFQVSKSTHETRVRILEVIDPRDNAKIGLPERYVERWLHDDRTTPESSKSHDISFRRQYRFTGLLVRGGLQDVYIY